MLCPPWTFRKMAKIIEVDSAAICKAMVAVIVVLATEPATSADCLTSKL